MNHDSIAVTGMGAISALGTTVEEFWRGLVSCSCGIARIRAFDTEGCRVDIAAEAPNPPFHAKHAQSRSAGSRTAVLALHAAVSALEQASYPPERFDRVGLVLGTTGGGTGALESFLHLGTQGHSRASRMLSFPKRAITDYVASAIGLGAPRVTINTACSSGAVAMIHARELISAGLCDAVLAGGADELLRYTLTGFCSLRAVDPEPCRPFDRARMGMSIGEGAGMMLLEKPTSAGGRSVTPIAWLAGVGHSCDAGHLTAPDPKGRGAAQAMRAALGDAGVSPEEIGFVNAHGTGTPLNDKAEVLAIESVLGPHAPTCVVHSIKSAIGHCMGAAGALEAIATVLSLHHAEVPPTLGLSDPEAGSAVDFVKGAPRGLSSRYGLSNSFGFGGNNATLLFAREPN